MKTLRNKLVIGLAVLGMGSAAVAVQAQVPEGGHSHAASQEKMQAKWGEHFAKHLAKLHDALKLTPSQQQAWLTYQAAIKPAIGERGEHGERAAWAGMSAPARLQKAIEMSKQRTAMMESHLAALNTFYATLTPEQQKVFDANTMGGEHRGHHRMDGKHQ